MNIEETKHQVKVMEAFICGATVKFRNKSDEIELWTTLSTDDHTKWDWNTYEYRLVVEETPGMRDENNLALVRAEQEGKLIMHCPKNQLNSFDEVWSLKPRNWWMFDKYVYRLQTPEETHIEVLQAYNRNETIYIKRKDTHNWTTSRKSVNPVGFNFVDFEYALYH